MYLESWLMAGDNTGKLEQRRSSTGVVRAQMVRRGLGQAGQAMEAVKARVERGREGLDEEHSGEGRRWHRL